MALKPGFWKGFKRTLLVLIAMGVVAAVLLFVLLPGNQGLFFGGATLILVLNLLMMLLFVRANDNKRPGQMRHREGQEDRRFNFRKEE